MSEEYLGNYRYKIKCDGCNDILGVYEREDIPKDIFGRNHGIGGKTDYKCNSCKNSWNARYDDYVDPLKAYRGTK